LGFYELFVDSIVFAFFNLEYQLNPNHYTNMRIGIISNTDSFIPFTYTLANQGVQVFVFFSASADPFVNQKVAAFVQQTKIPFTEERNAAKDVYQWLQSGNYDVCFVLGYAQLIKLDHLKSITTRLYNIHFGPLPGFRGPVPVFWQLKKGMANVGLAIHELSEKFDDGPVVWTKSVPNLPEYNYQFVNDLLGGLCVEGVFYILSLLMQRMPLPRVNTSGASMAYQKRPGLNDVLINWNEMDAAEICNLIKACNPWNKGALSPFKGQEVKLMDAIIIDADYAGQSVGTIVSDKQHIHIYCKHAKVINVNMLFYNNAFLPAYMAKAVGFIAGEKFGNMAS
jgi:methionyl-tRNA formyltransferase